MLESVTYLFSRLCRNVLRFMLRIIEWKFCYFLYFGEIEVMHLFAFMLIIYFSKARCNILLELHHAHTHTHLHTAVLLTLSQYSDSTKESDIYTYVHAGNDTCIICMITVDLILFIVMHTCRLVENKKRCAMG